MWRAELLSPHEQQFVAGLLRPGEVTLFWDQPIADVRHAHDCAVHVHQQRPGRPDLVRAALLHDVAKQRARLGPIGRSVATILRYLGIRGSDRHDSYNRHADEGADLLAAAGAEAMVVTYTRHHHQERPDGFDAGDWALLVEADQQH